MINWSNAQELSRKLFIYCVYSSTSIDRHRWDLGSDG